MAVSTALRILRLWLDETHLPALIALMVRAHGIDIPHPFVPETLERLAPLPPDERAKVRFLHLNHTNRMSDPEGPEAAAVRAAGSAGADELEWHAL